MTRWEALVRFDTEIREAAERLQPFGDIWVEALGKAFFALNEDRKYLPNIVEQLIKDALLQAAIEERKRAIEWLHVFSTTADGEATSEEAIRVLVEAETKGYRLAKDRDGAILASTEGGTYYLRTSAEIVTRLGAILSRKPE
jgi:hypothetical protein